MIEMEEEKNKVSLGRPERASAWLLVNVKYACRLLEGGWTDDDCYRPVIAWFAI